MRSGHLLIAALLASIFSAGLSVNACAAKKITDKILEIRLEAVRTDPKEPRNHFNLGLEYYNRGEFGKAQAALRQALQVSPANKAAHAAVDLDSCQLLGDMAIKQEKVVFPRRKDKSP
jgi:tetratricopeptide (TPR) repeat protein